MFTDLRIPADQRPMTPNEARISAALMTIFSLMILAAVLDGFEVRRLAVVFLIVLWIPMLVVHELGHALMARALGWRVREIVIGFGRDLWQWQIGETRLTVKLAPVEGYVLPEPLEPEGIRAKSALIYAAGPGAEFLVLALLLWWFGWHGVFGEAETVLETAVQSLALVIVLGGGFNLLPFRVGDGVSDGLDILSSPFMPEHEIQLRLITFELREVRRRLDAGRAREALRIIERQRDRFPDNEALALLEARVIAADDRTDEARDLIREKLNTNGNDADVAHGWRTLQARVELEAPDPEYLTLDLALQKALAATPNAPDLLALKGASLVRRGRTEEGGRMLADAWRRNDGSADAAMMLAWLTVAAHRCGAPDAAAHYREAFEHSNSSVALRARLLAEL